ncbi:MAG: hypothetical protein ACR2H4_19770 [Pyrinomonadaceae bacterium]
MVKGNSAFDAIQMLAELEMGEYQSTYCFYGSSVSLKADHHESVRFSDTYFSGYFETNGSLPSQITVTVNSDPSTLKYLTRLLRLSDDTSDFGIPKFLWLSPDHGICVRRLSGGPDKPSVLYALNKLRRSITLLIPPGDFETRYIPMRTVRAAMKLLMLERGMWQFHAACIAKNGLAIALTGNKFSGKTSTLVSALLNRDFDFVANDKVLVDRGEQSWFVYGLPVSSGIRIGTIRQFLPLLDLLNDPHEQHWDNHVLGNEDYRNELTRIYVKPQKLVEILKCSIMPRAKVKCFVVPELVQGITKSRLLRASHGEAKEWLMGQYLDQPFAQEPCLKMLFQSPYSSVVERAEISRMAFELPVYKLIQNELTNADSARNLEELLHS